MKVKFVKGMTTQHRVKMEGFVSFSTSNMCNDFCKKMKNIEGSICQRCFADRQFKMQKGTREKMARNEWIKLEVMKKSDVPTLNAMYFRFEAFGELETEIQLRNYMLIAKHNKGCAFTLFTKRVDLLRKFNGRKPNNFMVIISSPLINKRVVLEEKMNKMVDGIFTVYDKKEIIKEKININCGSMKCIDCLKCYKKSKETKIINEMLK